ncbi:FSR family fosmidomycin resistance protein-like MFS transporter [Bacillus mesophilus]|uniref:MFS transporter n=1 Tax=Bacillus mesophilus TaxID=1808955 RepID=A0A6M0QBG1_9BACI|nr:MFS transporter [Bacillus mesophilus]MBM7662527.1 FSR family fosmidomycin resistance protein-like MFS transporter [Bacillus mesophilus]NEY72850.1 MFS transporter [Bacillus mesophilus]
MAVASTNKVLPTGRVDTKTTYNILFILSICHLLNDTLQSVVPAMFPIFAKSMGLTFTQLGLIAFSMNIVSSVMQPAVGWYTDKRPIPFALPIGLTFSMIGILGLALAPSFEMILMCTIIIGLGSAIFHPEGSRVTHMAAGNRRGLAQSIYQVGGNSGQALAPIITALILVPLGQFGAIWFTLVAASAVILLLYIAKWYSQNLRVQSTFKKVITVPQTEKHSISKAIKLALLILILIVFARSWYGSAISNFYTFYTMESYGVTIAQSQIYIFVFLLFGAAGTFFGGPLADRFGRRKMIFLSLVGVAPLAIILPFVGPTLAFIVLGIIGFILLSSFSVTVVYAQELLPGKIGTMSGLIVGLAFGMGAIGSVALGVLIDAIGLTTTMVAVSFLPLLGLLTLLLPTDQQLKEWSQE